MHKINYLENFSSSAQPLDFGDPSGCFTEKSEGGRNAQFAEHLFSTRAFYKKQMYS